MPEFVEQTGFEVDYRIDFNGNPLLDDLDNYDLNTRELREYTSALENIIQNALVAGDVPDSTLHSIYSDRSGKGLVRSVPESSTTPLSSNFYSDGLEGSINIEAYHILDSEDKEILKDSIIDLLEEKEEQNNDFPYPSELSYNWNEETGLLEIGIENIETLH